jgi:hypothetical protein
MGARKIDDCELRRLCADFELSDIDIARQFGVTREGIRCARNRLGIKGRGDARVALLQQRRMQREEKLRCRKIYESRQALRRIKSNAAKLGIDFELLPHSRGRGVRIANAVCHLVKGQFIEKAHHCRVPYVYGAFARPTTRYPFDILIAELPRGWMIVPYDRLPKKCTMFVVNREKRNPGATCRRLDWSNYYFPNCDWLRAFLKNETLVHDGSASEADPKPAAAR